MSVRNVLQGTRRSVLGLLASSTALLLPCAALAGARECAASPDSRIQLCIAVQNGKASWEVSRDGQPVIAPSALGMDFAGEGTARFTGLSGAKRSRRDSSWDQPWGEQRRIRDRHTELSVTLSGDTALTAKTELTFRIFDDGLGFRYRFASIPANRVVDVVKERTEFRPVGDYQAWWYQALQPDRDEYLYAQTDARRITLAETPLTLRRSDGLHLSFHEAALVDFPSMLLAGDGSGTLTARLMPLPGGVLAKRTGAFATPWRAVLIGANAGALADSRIELNLNEPNKLGDVSWVKPGKYVGIWWEMHLERSTWGSGPKHGANTTNTKRYMDFAAKYGFDGVLVEGWNKGWDGDWIANGDKFSFTQAYPDFDIAAITAYGKTKGVRLIGHNETAGGIPNYEAQLKDALALFQRMGVTQVKTGYVRPSGTIQDAEGKGHWFADQYMVRHNLHVAQTAARYKVAVNAHEPVKDTGLRRTWPNMISREGARGQEFNAWGRPTNPPEHTVILPFTRMLAGPMDYTPGIFDIEHGKTVLTERVQSTLAVQLALYVVLYSPVQMAADLPENYEKRMDAFQFIRDVPTDWETSRTLQAEIGDFAIVARQARGGRDWFLGALTDENQRTLAQRLDFLEAGKRYEAQIYRDGPGADYRTNPLALTIERRVVRSTDVMTFNLAPGGGAAVRFRALD